MRGSGAGAVAPSSVCSRHRCFRRSRWAQSLFSFCLQIYEIFTCAQSAGASSFWLAGGFYGLFVHKEVGDVVYTKHVRTRLRFYFHFPKSQVVHALSLTLFYLMKKKRQSGAVATHPSNDTWRRPVRTFRVKMVLLGGSNVGKSSLALRFARSEFRSVVPTVGCK